MLYLQIKSHSEGLGLGLPRPLGDTVQPIEVQILTTQGVANHMQAVYISSVSEPNKKDVAHLCDQYFLNISF